MKYLYLAIRLGTLWENLKGIGASEHPKNRTSYQPAAAAILGDPGMQKWLGRRPLDRLPGERGLR